MAREPSYPGDAPVGASRPAPLPSPPAPSEPIAEDPKGASDSRRTKHIVAGAAIGIGSAAIVAALLYANRNRRGDKD